MFKLVKIELGRINVPEPEYHVASVAVEPGMALTLSAGKLAKASGKPAFVALGAAKVDETVAVGRVTPDCVYEVAASASLAAINVGDKVTVNSDALQITATTTSGVATIVNKLGDQLALVRFE